MRLTIPVLLALLVSLMACSDDTGTGGGATGGASPGGAAPGGAGTGGAGGAAIDCEALTDFDACRAAGPCDWVEAMASCPGNTGVSGCFWTSCADCPVNTSCQPVSGGDGADGCIDVTSCVLGAP